MKHELLLVREMPHQTVYPSMKGESLVDDLNDRVYPFKEAHEHSLCSEEELSSLGQLIDREYESLRSDLSSDECCEDERLLLKAKCLACVQMLGLSIFEDQQYLHKAYDIESAKALYADWSRLGLAFNVISSV